MIAFLVRDKPNVRDDLASRIVAAAPYSGVPKTPQRSAAATWAPNESPGSVFHVMDGCLVLVTTGKGKGDANEIASAIEREAFSDAGSREI